MLSQSGVISELSGLEQETLLCVVSHMIPPSEELRLPGASDAKIFADILRSIGRDLPALRRALYVLNEMAGQRLDALAPAHQATLVTSYRSTHPDLAAVLGAVTVRCYYRDDRVMASLGMERRPPFPLGFDVPQGDWSLLEPVRLRGKIYRDVY
ncbi:hypothetical protein [Microvirga lotononidis]|uniref:Gluconate 2-dehydrogenase subunit 3 n=1 Tax=Microvirga lotononidis TaxID=864069 RepID=I4Z153_9HYPH|nr:hypothetical protein [Microvirga lotononidis]EIM29945.1 hypothetical protein MicloDRAFT_00012660 [Microvirga lotononidis]WQO31993.1 hypothetical protein U0023_32190 [Microvirga lotononidis]